MESLAFICITPEEAIAGAKNEDEVHDLRVNDTRFSSLYTSKPEMLLGRIAFTQTIIALYFPAVADKEYEQNAKKLIKKFGKDENFFVISERGFFLGCDKIRTYEKRSDIKLCQYFASIAKTCANFQKLAA